MSTNSSQTLLDVTYETPSEACEVYTRELSQGALFVPDAEGPDSGEKVTLKLHFPFSGGELELEGEVVISLPESIREAGGTPGVAVALSEQESVLRMRMTEETGVSMPKVKNGSSLRAPRFHARTAVTLEADGRRFQGETLDISYNGVLALITGIDLSDGTELSIEVEHPRGGPPLKLVGRLAHATRCDHGVMAHGVQFSHPLDRVDEVNQFVDDVRGHQHARKLGTVAGSLRNNRLEAVIDTFATVSPKGTLRLAKDKDEGKLVYAGDHIVSVTCGLVSGAKALGRIFAWDEAAFEFEPQAELVDVADDPLPLTEALLTASLERDDLSRLDFSSIDPNESFQVDEERLRAVEGSLDEVARELAANAEMGFPLAALLDILPASDARIYKSLAELLEAGIVLAPAA